MNIKKQQVILSLAVASLIGCATEKEVKTIDSQTDQTVFNSELGIEAVPASLGNEYAKHFNRYTKVVAPNGKPIHLVAQNEISDEQLLRSRGILEHFLEDLPGSQYGSDKGEIANKMAENNAVLVLLNGQDDGKNPVRVRGQALFKNEIQVEGHDWYINQNYEHRDAAYEEILHFVHDHGIGVDGHNSLPGAAPEYQQEIRAASDYGLTNKLWADDERAKDWIEELRVENSLSQEYLAAVIDTYYGLWGAWDGKSRRGEADSDKGMWGMYTAKTRDHLESRDPMAYDLMNSKFFHPYLTYNARIDGDFSGTFSLKFDPSISYTHHSQYLKDITLLGSKDTGVRVNELDNDITGNEGLNTVSFSGNADDYTVETNGGVTIVRDNKPERDGNNVLKEVEKLEFVDKTVDL